MPSTLGSPAKIDRAKTVKIDRLDIAYDGGMPQRV
jgi:hypothetical protein